MSTRGIHRDTVTAWFEQHADVVEPPLEFDLAMGHAQPNGGAEAFVGRIDSFVIQATDDAAKVA